MTDIDTGPPTPIEAPAKEVGGFMAKKGGGKKGPKMGFARTTRGPGRPRDETRDVEDGPTVYARVETSAHLEYFQQFMRHRGDSTKKESVLCALGTAAAVMDSKHFEAIAKRKRFSTSDILYRKNEIAVAVAQEAMRLAGLYLSKR